MSSLKLNFKIRRKLEGIFIWLLKMGCYLRETYYSTSFQVHLVIECSSKEKISVMFLFNIILSFSCSFFSSSSYFLNKHFVNKYVENLQTFIYGIYGKISICFLSWKFSKQNHTSNELKQLKFKPLSSNFLRHEYIETAHLLCNSYFILHY